MNSKPKKLIAALCGVFVATAALAQTTYVWTNQVPTYPSTGNLGISANWNPNGLALPSSADILEWNGSTTGNLALTLSTGFSGSSGQTGIQLYMNAAQTSNLQIGPPAGVNAGTPRVTGILIDNGAGQFSLGDSTLNTLEIVWGAAFTHILENDSTYPAIIYPNVEWRMGGGGVHTYDFTGTGDWIVNSYVHSDNGAGSAMQKDGTGTVYWFGTNVPAATYAGSLGLTLNSGKVVLESPGLLTTVDVHLDTGNAGGTLLEYNATNGSGTISSVISGYGPLQVNAGTLTLSGNNSYTGSNYLTGGEIIALHTENLGTGGPLGVGGVITFAGGTLGYSAVNTYDYSPRFDTSPGQAYSIDVPSGLSVTFTNNLTSSGGTLAKLDGGTLTLAGANTYGGTTTVGGGTLVIQGTAGTGNITVADGQTLGVVENGTPFRPGAMTLGTTSAGVNLQFFNLTNTTAAPIAVSGAISAPGAITVSINSGLFNIIGETFPLITWGSGPAPAVNNPPTVSGAAGILSTNGNTIWLTITVTPYAWTGGIGPIWDASTAGNWKQSGGPVIWQNGVLTLFDDNALANTNVTISGDLKPASVTVDNNTLSYSITSSAGNIIDGTNSLTKVGNSTLTFAGGLNAYTGVTTVGGGTMIVSTLANGGSPSDIGAATSGATNLVLNGGTLQYIGSGASIDRQVSVGTSGGALDSSGTGALSLSANKALGLSGSGVHALTLTGTSAISSILAANIGDSSGGATILTKNGSGTWILTGTNTFSGVTAIHGGTLQIGNGGGSGNLGGGSILDNSALDINSTGTETISGLISGNGSVTNDGPGTTIFLNNNSYTGVTVINAGILQIGNGGGAGLVNGATDITNNSKLVFNSTASVLYGPAGGLHGTGNVEIKTGKIKATWNNDYTGWTLIDAGALFTANDNNSGYDGGDGILATSVITNNGTFRMLGYTTRGPMYASIVGTGAVQVGATGGNYDNGDEILAGTNTYTGGTFIGETHLILGDGSTPGAGAIVGNVTFTNNFEDANDGIRRLIFDRPDDFTFGGNIVTNFATPVSNLGIVEQNGSGTITLTGNNTYGSGTVINAGTLMVGNGGTSGSIGTGAVTDDSVFVWNQSGLVSFSGDITGSGSFVNLGAGTLTLASTNVAYTGATTLSNGTLVVTGQVIPETVALGGGDLDMEGGTLIVGGSGVAVTNMVANNLNIDSGTIVFTLNKSVSASNTVFDVTNIVSSYAGSINITGGTLKLINAGPALQVGDRFTLFPVSYPGQISGAGTLKLVTPGFAVSAANLGVDGSVTVTAVQPAPSITATASGSQLNLQWPSAWIGGVHLQSQTNSLAKGLGTNWVTIPGTDAGNTYAAPVSRTNGAVFYRLAP